MKILPIILSIFFFTKCLKAQESKISFYSNDGSKYSYNIKQITTITFTDDSLINNEYEIKFFSKDSILWVNRTGIIDSIRVIEDPNKNEFIETYSNHIPFADNALPLSLIDSITLRYIRNDNVNRYRNKYKTENGFYDNGSFHSALWKGNRVYCSGPIRYFDLDTNLISINDSTLFKNIPLFIRFNTAGNKLLFINSASPDVSIGQILESNLDSQYPKILDSGNYNSSAVYIPGSDNIIFYTYGSYSKTNRMPNDAGYYLMDRLSGKKTFLLHYISDLGPDEMVNGFDISSDGRKLLIPFVSDNRNPLVVEYDFNTKKLDTVTTNFDILYDRVALWLRYNHDASKILYCNYPLHSFGQGGVSEESEIGIIDQKTGIKRILNANPEIEYAFLNVFPEWSPDEAMIIYGSSGIATEPAGAVGAFQVCILKSLK